MGVINCKKEVASKLPIYPDGMVKMVNLFNLVPTLNQRDYEKWSYPVFSFKILRDGKWFLGTFYEDGGEEVGLAFSEFTDED